MEQSIISIIIPIYNVAPYLEKCIQSVLNQTYKNLQIILVDDGSIDDSPAICRRYQKQDSRITVIHKANAGLVSARKAGMQAAFGEYIGYVDGDDWIEPDMYKHLFETMQNTGADMIETACFREAEGVSQKSANKIPAGIYTASELIPDMLCNNDFNECRLLPYLWSKLFKRELLQDIQMNTDNQIQLGEDAAVTYLYVLKCSRIVISDYAGYHYIQRKDSMTSQKTAIDRQSNQALLRCLGQAFQADKNADCLLKQLNQYAKLLFLLRQIEDFDRIEDSDKQEPEKILSPFGSLKPDSRVVIYGAGSLGRSIYEYLQKNNITITAWIDREYQMYQKLGWQTENPQNLIRLKDEFDWLIIAVFSRSTMQHIRKNMIEIGIQPEKILWLTEAFIETKILDSVFVLES